MNYYLQLPEEIRGKINSFICDESVINEFKYASKDTFNSMRYVTKIYGDIVYLKNLFIKTKNNTFIPFYYNLQCISGKLILSSDKDELREIHRIIKQLKTLQIIYTGNSIITTFPLIQMFVNSECCLMEVYSRKCTSMFFTVERRSDRRSDKQNNSMVVAYIIPIIKQKEICNYLNGVDSLLMEVSTKHHDNNGVSLNIIKLDGISATDILTKDNMIVINEPHLLNLMIQCNITTIHLADYGTCHEFREVLEIINTLYVEPPRKHTEDYFSYVEREDEDDVLFPNITKVIFEDVLIDNQSDCCVPHYTVYSKLLPNAEIEVYKIHKYPVLIGNNVVESKDNLKVKSLVYQQLSNMFLENGEVRFPNLINMKEIYISLNEYPGSVESIRKAIKTTQSLHIIVEIEEEKRILPDILKYVCLFDSTVKRKLVITTNGDYSNKITFRFIRTIIGIQFEVQSNKLTKDDYFDISYLRKYNIVIKLFYPIEICYYIVKQLCGTKVIVNSCILHHVNILLQLPFSVNTLYLINDLRTMKNVKQNTQIKNIIYNDYTYLQHSSFNSWFYPEATYQYIPSIYKL